MTTAVLLLNADFNPIKVISWERAVCMFLDGKVRVIEEYAGRLVRSASTSMGSPAVVALIKYADSPSKIRFNRKNVLARDRYTCQYCAVRPLTKSGNPRIEDLTLDHVVPRAQARHFRRGNASEALVTLPWNKKQVPVTCWENVVCACMDCNALKADRTPAQAGLTLRAFPHRPTVLDAVRMGLTMTRIPNEWRNYLPENSVWRDYWDIELDSD